MKSIYALVLISLCASPLSALTGKERLRDSATLTLDKVLYRKGETLNYTAAGLKQDATHRLTWMDSFRRIIRIEDLKPAADP